MKKFDRILHTLNSFLGVLSIGIFLYALVVLRTLRPRMIAFEPLTSLQENLLTGVGLGLLVILAYFLLSLLQIIRMIRNEDQLRLLPLILIILGVISVLFIFSDVALLSDIHNQFEAGFDQPEWTLVFPILGFQLLFSCILTFLHLSGAFLRDHPTRVARDINIFLVVQVVGVISGGMGLALSGLGFFFPRAWSLPLHTIMGGLTLLFPYVLAVVYWGVLKLREPDRQWWDEKQAQDVGRAAVVTLALDTVLMLALFLANLPNLAGVIRLLWLPLYLFATITFFSLGNLYFSSRV